MRLGFFLVLDTVLASLRLIFTSDDDFESREHIHVHDYPVKSNLLILLTQALDRIKLMVALYTVLVSRRLDVKALAAVHPVAVCVRADHIISNNSRANETSHIRHYDPEDF